MTARQAARTPIGRDALVARPAGVVLDLVVVAVFVAIGRSAHAHGESVTGFMSTAWPFATGLGLGWLVVIARPTLGRWSRVAVIWIGTVAVGMVLRLVVGQGTAFAFILVALGFLGAGMFGWRIALWSGRARRATSRVRPVREAGPTGNSSTRPPDQFDASNDEGVHPQGRRWEGRLE